MSSVGAESRSGGTTAKRQAILDGALAVFARDGYARASIDAIAKTADVSTRTIYNHFTDKAGLFAAVVEAGATAVSRAHIDRIDTILGGITSAEDLEPALVDCGLALHSVVPPEAPHWGLVRHVHADADHIPPEVIDVWRRLGPARVKRQLALHLADLDRRGLLRLDDPHVAAVHYSALTGSAWGSALEPDPSAERAAELMNLAVAAFLRGYAR
ncbi:MULTISPECIES: TetR/AcrR family transcriptional regulator [Planomonospora]|uniref:TetR/AcrR family transcriptional regulator n=1 Tax=Planomonospora TaxID=1998 RepID=UPI0018C39D0C|nr:MULTISPECIES: TetR/AcrR family transcriptional regulator [Planomonospora]